MRDSARVLVTAHWGRWAAVLLALLVIATAVPAVAQLPAGGRIGNNDAPTAASIDISTSTRPDGSVARVVLGRNDVFPDNLAGSGAAGADGALLLVDPTPAGLSEDVGREIARLLPTEAPAECGTGLDAEVILLGGEAALSAQLFTELEENFCVDRLAGPSRVETSTAIAAALLASGAPRGTLLVARDDNPADSAAAGAWSAATGSPIVVTSSTSLHPSVAALLDPANGQWDRVVLLGGTAALSADVEAQVRAAAGAGTEVVRIAGAARDDTALQIGLQLWGGTAGAAVAIVNGYSDTFWTYALPGGVAASSVNAPLLYVQTDAVPGTTASYLGDRMPTVTTIGPAGQVSDATKAEAERIAGGGGTTPPPAANDLRIIGLTPDADGTVTVTAAPGDYSITVVATAADGSSQVFFDGVTGPGIALGQDDIAEGATFGDNALVFPFLPDQQIQPGDYAFPLFSDGGIGTVQAIVKSGDPNARQVLDANFFVVTDHQSIDEQAERDALSGTYRQIGEQIFGQQNLGVGTMQILDVPADLKARHSQLEVAADDGNSPEIRHLCSSLRGLSGEARTINFAIVDNIVADPPPPPGQDAGETEGIAAGIPGVPLLADMGNSCVIIIANGGRDIDQLGTTTWHEAGHFLGLFHTSEEDGATFDPLPDTPECRDPNGDGTIDEQECGAAGQNFMFYDSDSTNMTAHQAFVMRHNPLFRPA